MNRGQATFGSPDLMSRLTIDAEQPLSHIRLTGVGDYWYPRAPETVTERAPGGR